MKRILSVAVAVLILCAALSACAPAEEEAAAAPIEEFSTADAMNEKLGFSMPTLDVTGYRPTNFQVFDGELGQVTYEHENGTHLKLRMQAVNDDICGVEGAQDGGMHEVGDQDVWFGYLNDTKISQWGQDGYTYCIVGEGVSDAVLRRATVRLEKQIGGRDAQKAE